MNTLLLDVLDGKQVERPPIWLMRQAGRILPQYRKVRAGMGSFVDLVKNPEKAAEVTIQPVDELGVDAAILFSDILVIPECMGLEYHLVKNKGPVFPKTINDPGDIDQLIHGEIATKNLGYVYNTIGEIKNRLDRVPLIGFSGAPWTLFCYMLEGEGSKTFSKARRFLYQHPEASHKLMDKLAVSVAEYLKSQLENGVDCVQIFDSWAGMLGQDLYKEFGIKYIEQILSTLPTGTRTIVFSKGASSSFGELLNLDCKALGFDWSYRPSEINSVVKGRKVVQGNLDPCVLYGDEKTIKEKTLQLLTSFDEKHIVNLGHGVYPDTPLDGVKTFVNTVKSYRY
ncbi:uroporphyrinogen decarboxylase [Membranihabitans maritimus]|uniref:uroporphyrinogen decarboxylase n=1 Tax=Membranihabitans maritimus TaxID=2904244 RepID=UPI001F01C242|nr:uroporphyrinogen decarboxylase [Membranihabitans maritimus]